MQAINQVHTIQVLTLEHLLILLSDNNRATLSFDECTLV